MRVVPGLQAGKVQVYIQVSESVVEGLEPGAPGLGGEMASAVEDGLTQRMEVIAEAISQVCDQLYGRIERAIQKTHPNELTLEFGIKLGGKAGIPFVTEGSAEGTVKVTAKWSTNSSSDKKEDKEDSETGTAKKEDTPTKAPGASAE